MTSSAVTISLETFQYLLNTNCILNGWFLQNLPKVKEELGMLTYHRLVEMAVEALTESQRTDFNTSANEGRQAQHADGAYWDNPYNPITEEFKNAGWSFGWIRAKHDRM